MNLLSPDYLLPFYAAVLAASFLSSSLGIGGFFLIPLAALAFGPKESVGIITLYFLIQNIFKIIFFKRSIAWKTARSLILWSLPGVLAGAALLPVIPVAVFQKVLSFAVLLFLLNDMFHWIRASGVSRRTQPFFGMLYGFASGFLGSGNLIKGSFLSSLGFSKESYLGTYAVTSLAMNIPKVVMYSATGIIERNMLMVSLPFLFLSLIGTAGGKIFLKKIPEQAFSLAVHIFLSGSALFLFFQS